MKRRILCLIAGLLLTATVATADPVLDLVGAGVAQTDPRSFTIGWAFDITVELTIDALGFWDEGSNGLDAEHLVSLWTDTGTLLTSATVTNASTPVASTLAAGQWLFEGIAPLGLEPGRYVLGADGSIAVDAVRLRQLFTTIPGVTWVENRYSTPEGFPTNTDPTFSPGIFGPNMSTQDTGEPEPVPVPEPGSLLLVLLGGVGLFAKVRR